MRETKFTKRATAVLLSVAMLFTMSGTPVYAVSGGKDAGATGLCEHHPAHTEDCGYVEAQPGTPCSHEHTEECYRLVEKCVHEHTSECYPEGDVSENDATPSNAKALEPTECSHVCSISEGDTEDTGCNTKVLDCPHEHDADCGYTKGTEGSPCAFVCDICNAEDSGKQENQEPKECVCEEACTEESINGDCPVCGAKGADLSDCKGIKAESDVAAEKVIPAWQWVDPDGNLVDGGLALPGVDEENQADFDTVVSMLPEAIKATVTGAEEPETVVLAGWTCATFMQDENGGWPVTGTYDFIAELPEGYGLEKGAEPLEIQVTLGGANLLAGETEITIDGLTFQGDDLSGITRQEDGQIVISTESHITISGTWNGSITGVVWDNPKSVILVSKDVSANITLSNINITVSKNYVAAFQIAVDSTGNVSITLEGDNTLKSGERCAGLQKNGEGENIGKLTINGEGTLEATGGANGAGIGGGISGAGSTLTINGGTVTANGGEYGAGIGGGISGAGRNITINGGKVTANGGASGAGIGGGNNGAASAITIYGGTMIANGGKRGAGIGGGSYRAGSDILITGGTVTATGGEYGAGIGGGAKGAGSDITISGGDVNATGSYGGAGIGGGYDEAGSDITISGGDVTATGSGDGAGIGGGSYGAGSDITISGGIVTATGGSGGPGIGGGYNSTGSAGNKLDGNAVVFAMCGQNVTDHIQGFDESSLTSGILFQGDAGKVYGNPAIDMNVTIEAGKTLTIEAGQTLTINKGVTLTNFGTITNHGIISNQGAINNYGTIGGNGTIDPNQPNTTPSQAKEATFIKDGQPVDKAAIGDTVLLQVKIAAANMRSRMAAPDQVIFKLDGKEITRATVTGGTAASDSFTLSIDQGWQLGENTLTVEYGGSGNNGGFLDSTSTVTLTINGITADGITITSDDGAATYTEGSGFTLETDGGNYEISGTWNGAITGAASDNPKSVILVKDGVNANITLSDVNIDVSGTDYVAAFKIAYNSIGNVSITLKNTNTLISGDYCAGLQKNGEGNIGELTISGAGTLDATGGYAGAGIGGGVDGPGSAITISSGTVTATGGAGGAGIGGGKMRTGSAITISGGTVTATGGDGNNYGYGGTGIGRGGYSINDVAPDSAGNKLDGNAVVFATGGANTNDHITGYDAGLTSGVLFEGDTGKVYGTPTISTDATIPEDKILTIKGEQTLTVGPGVTLTNNGTINCYGNLTGKVGGTGKIYRTSQSAVAFWKDGVPVREAEYGDTIQIKVTAQKTPAKSLFRSAARDTVDFWLGEIGTGIKLNESPVGVQSNDDGTVTAVLSLKLSGDNWKIQNNTATNFTIYADFGGSTDTALLESQNSASFSLKSGSCTISMQDKTVPYDETAKEIDAAVITGADGESLKNEINYTYYTDADCTTKTTKANSGAASEGDAPVNVGIYYVKATALAGGNYKETVSAATMLKIIKGASTLDGLKTYKDGTQTTAFIYGDTITVKFTPKAQTVSAYRMAEPTINEAALFLGDKQLTDPVRATEGAECTLSYTIAHETPLTIGKNELTVKYGGGGNLNYVTDTIDITLGQKPLTATVDSSDASATKTYDGTTDFTGVKLVLDNSEILTGDTVTATADGTAADANVGNNKTLTVTDVHLDGSESDFYSLANNKVSGSVTVAKREAVLTWDNLTLTYNGKEQAPAAVISNKVGSDDVAVTVTGGQTNAGSYTAQVSGLTGMTAKNYSLPSNRTIEFTIQKAAAAGSVTLDSTDANNNHKLDTGDTVTVNTSGVTPAGGTERYQWKKIVGGETRDLDTGNSHTLTGDDTRGKIYCVVTFDGNVTGKLESNRLDIAKELLTGPITITGGTNKGDILTVSAPANAGITSADYTVTWHRDNGAITGASGLTHTIVREDLGKTLSVIITANETSEYFTGTLTSNELEIPAVAPEEPALTANAEDSAVTLTWKKPFDNGSAITGYSLAVKQGDKEITGSPFAIGADAESYHVTGLSNGMAYSFTLTAINSAGRADSNTVSATPKRKNDNGNHNGGNSNNDGGNGNSGGGSSSSDDLGNSGNHTTITPPAGQTTDTPTIGEITIGKHKDGVADIPTGQIESTLKQAQKDAEKNGRNEKGVAVSVELPNGTTSATLGRTALDKLTGAGAKILTLTFGGASMTFSLDALKEIAKQSAGTVTFSVKPATLTGDAKKAISKRPAFDFTVSCQKDGKTVYITNFGKDGISLAIRYTPATGEQAGSLFAVCGDGGKAEWITPSSYDQNNKVLRFTAHHLSIYGVGYKTPPAFTDTVGHWAKADIDFVVSRGLLSGTSAATFNPDTSMTRGMFVTALGRLAGIDPASYQTRSFSDVKADAYYAAYVEWAAKQDIVKSAGEGLFSPDTPVTREQMAVIMTNYAGQMGYTIPATLKENTFTDHSAISAWAAKEVKAMQTAGIITGKDGNRFDPQGSATRAEVAAVLRRFVELVIDPATADGWTKNDSGHWLYHKDGKTLTGWQTIGALRYYFNADGVMHEGWKQEPVSGNWYYWTNDGAVTGWRKIDGKWYYFDQYGIMAVNRKIDDYEVGPDGARKE